MKDLKRKRFFNGFVISSLPNLRNNTTSAIHRLTRRTFLDSKTEDTGIENIDYLIYITIVKMKIESERLLNSEFTSFNHESYIYSS